MSTDGEPFFRGEGGDDFELGTAEDGLVVSFQLREGLEMLGACVTPIYHVALSMGVVPDPTNARRFLVSNQRRCGRGMDL